MLSIVRGIVSSPITVAPCDFSHSTPGVTIETLPSVGGANVADVQSELRALPFGLDTRRSGLLVVTNAHDAIESFAHGLDVRDEDDLLEPILEPMQEIDDVMASGLVER